MPNYRSINLELRSQYDIDPIPEFRPPQPSTNELQPYSAMREMKVVDESSSTCTVYIPTYPSSQFWIAYSIAPPIPPAAYFLFKLFINGAHVVSWGCGKDDEWKGKTMFGLYERPEQEGDDGRKRIEKRAIFFAGLNDRGKEVHWDDPTAFMEVRVHRAKGRRRIARQIEEFGKTFHAAHGRGLDLVNAGLAKKEHPKRFYEFALIDPVDQPFATFKFYYRTLDQLQQLGVSCIDSDSESGLSGTASERSFSGEVMTRNDKSDRNYHSSGSDGDITPTPTSKRQSLPSHAKNERNENSSPAHDSVIDTPKHFYRLSIPPSLKLSPSMPSFRVRAPRKITPSSSLPTLSESLEDWDQRTPSPVRSIRSTINSPAPEGKKKGNSMSALKKVVSNALRRRAASSSPAGPESVDASPLLSTSERC